MKRSSPYRRTEPEDHGVTVAAPDEARFEEKSRESAYINPESWLRVLFEAEEATVVEEQIDTIAKKLDDWLYSENFERVDEVFELLNEKFFELHAWDVEVITSSKRQSIEAEFSYLLSVRKNSRTSCSGSMLESAEVQTLGSYA